MITILQRQNVSKRTAPSVPSRARTNGVRWSSRDLPAPRRSAADPPPVRPDRPISILSLQSPRRSGGPRHGLFLRQGGLPRREAWESHSFLRDQLVRRKNRRAEKRDKRERRVRSPLFGRLRQHERRHHEPRREKRGAPAGLLPGGEPAPGRTAGRRFSVAGLLRNPWFYVSAAALIGAAFLVPALGAAGVAGPRPAAVLPPNSDVDSALYNLLIPDSPLQSAAGSSPVLLSALKVSTYRTTPGDSLSRIAARFKLNVDTLVSWNGIRDARALPSGTELSVPNRNGVKYTVRRGDTLQGIANAWGVDFNGILDANMLGSSVINIGQDLFIPDAHMNPNELNKVLGSLFMHPVQGRISSYFGERPDPFTGMPNYHNGVDIVNTPGTPILAAMAGTVRVASFNFNYGNYVILQHTGGYQTLYGHLSKSIVSRGQKVSQGQEIGELGTTGYSTGPHLHFSIFRNGEAVDPLRFLK
jgi:murein DD-endopeptidase MepM/ murein hydrolase activator NlpD